MERTKMIFYSKEFIIDRGKVKWKDIEKNKNLLHSADLDYISAKLLNISWDIFIPVFLTHVSQAFEKYLKFINYTILLNQEERSHSPKSNFANNSFSDCIPKEKKEIIDKTLKEFTSYRYLDKNFKAELISIMDALDEFVMYYYKFLSEFNIIKALEINAMINTINGQNNNKLNKMLKVFYLKWSEVENIIKVENKFYEQLLGVIEKHKEKKEKKKN